MKVRCPHCRTLYRIDPDGLALAENMASCYRCGTTFDVDTDATIDLSGQDVDALAAVVRLNPRCEIPDEAGATADDAMPDATPPDRPPTVAATLKGPDAGSREPPPHQPPPDLPFDMPGDLPDLEASPDAALDVAETLADRPRRSRVLYALLALLLAAALALQLAWQYRLALLDAYPALEPVCEYLPCRPSLVHEPDRFRVLQRDILPTANDSGSLTLQVKFRNTADTAQALPDIQLSLLDNNGGIVIRRRLAPRDYLFPPPPDDRVVAAGEVITFSIDFKDPGYHATGFVIDFL